MLSRTPNDRGYRFPAEIISRAGWLFYRFSLSLRDIEELPAPADLVTRLVFRLLFLKVDGVEMRMRFPAHSIMWQEPVKPRSAP